MSLTHRSERVGGTLYASIRGSFGLRDAQEAYRGVLEHCIAEAVDRLFMDCREVEGEPTTLERYEFGEYVAASNHAAFAAGEAKLKVAIVGRVPLIDPQRFGEMVARNRGAVVTVTTDLDEAVAWLAVDPAVVARLAEDEGGEGVAGPSVAVIPEG